MAGSGFYDAGPLKQLAVNLLYGWGYNFYRAENQLRADDQLVRAKAAWLLGLTQASVAAAEQAYRREAIAPPTRAKPFPDPAVVADAQALERLAAAIGAEGARLHALPAPANDRMTQRYRQEAETLRRLGECDEQLVGRCELLRTLTADRPPAALLAAMAELEAGVRAIAEGIRERQALLAG